MVYNFSSGPAMIAEAVLKEANEEFLNYAGSGMSVMEINHRSPLFNNIVDEAKQDLKELLNIPDNYEILFLQGGASLQFSAIPMNIMKKGKAGFVLSGHWSKRAYDEAKKYGQCIVLASSEKSNYNYVPDISAIKEYTDFDYVHICENNTIYGTRFIQTPKCIGTNLVSDMSSCILSEPIDVSKYGIIYAGAQKNLGPAGVTLVIIRKDLIYDEVLNCTPEVCKYKNQFENNSRYNTPPTYGIYMCGKTFKWLKSQGGVNAINEINKEKAKIMYDFIDQSSLFTGTAQREYRSLMNVTFTTGNANLDMEIVEDSKKYGFVGIKGHRFVGGLRASLYNAIPKYNVEKLVDYLYKYEKNM